MRAAILFIIILIVILIFQWTSGVRVRVRVRLRTWRNALIQWQWGRGEGNENVAHATVDEYAGRHEQKEREDRRADRPVPGAQPERALPRLFRVLQSGPFLRSPRSAGRTLVGRPPRSQRFVLQGADSIGGRVCAPAERPSSARCRAFQAGPDESLEISGGPPAARGAGDLVNDRPLAGPVGEEWKQSAGAGGCAMVGAGEAVRVAVPRAAVCVV